MDEEVTTYIDGWYVTYPAMCNGRLCDMGFVSFNYGSDFVYFNDDGEPYGTYMPKAVIRRIRAMRNRYMKARTQ